MNDTGERLLYFFHLLLCLLEISEVKFLCLSESIQNKL